MDVQVRLIDVEGNAPQMRRHMHAHVDWSPVSMCLRHATRDVGAILNSLDNGGRIEPVDLGVSVTNGSRP